MASVFKQTYKSGGKTKKYSNWSVKFRDHSGAFRKVSGFTDKALSQELGRKLERLAQFVAMHQPPDAEISGWLQTIDGNLKSKLAKWGMLDPRAVAEAKPLSAHIDEFRRYLNAKDNTSDHVKLTASRLRKAFDGCKFVFPSELSADKLYSWLKEQRTDGNLSVRTSNDYLRCAKAFAKWMVANNRMQLNVFAHLEGGNVETDRKLVRRALSLEDFGRLIQAARNSQQVHRGLSGDDRAMLYLMAGRTGLRAQELASLTCGHLDLNSTPATVRIDAGDEKARRGAVLPLVDDIAVEITNWLSYRELNTVSIGGARAEKLWPGKWFNSCSKMLRRDLEAARTAWIAEAHDDAEHERRKQSDRLQFVDADGLQFDFHALRSQFITDLGRAGVSLQDAQRLARHSDPKLTASVYTKLSVSDLGQSVNKLPKVPTSPRPLAATGTTDSVPRPTNRETTSRTKPGAEQCRSVPKTDSFAGSEKPGDPDAAGNEKPRKPLGSQGFESKTSGESGIRTRGPGKPEHRISNPAHSATLASLRVGR